MRQRKESRKNLMRFRAKRRRMGNQIRFKVKKGFFSIQRKYRYAVAGRTLTSLEEDQEIIRRHVTNDHADRT